MKPEINAVDISLISEVTTNGDIIKFLFPYTRIRYATRDLIGITFFDNQSEITIIDYDWWRSPYKGGKYERSRDSQENDI